MPQDPTPTAAAEQAEEWRDIADFPGYQVSDRGNVRTCHVWRQFRDGRWRPVCPGTLPTGYKYVRLQKGKRGVSRYIHRLVLEAFVGPCPEGMESRHVNDRDPSNNSVGNLAWGTRQQNIDDKHVHGTTAWGSRAGCAKLTEEQTGELLRLAADGVMIKDLARKYGIRKENVSKIVNGHHWVRLGGPRKPAVAPVGYVRLSEAMIILGLSQTQAYDVLRTLGVPSVLGSRYRYFEEAGVRAALTRPGQRKR